MSTIAIFHPDLGIRAGVLDAAHRLSAAGHTTRIVDYYGDGRSFDDHTRADEYVTSIGFPTLMQAALDAVADLPDGFSVLGFSNGAGMAEYIATRRRVSKAVLGSGTLPVKMMGADTWPAGTAVQIHYSLGDPFRNEQWLDSVAASIRESGATLELYADYPGNGHLFTDPTLPDFDASNTELFWSRALTFLA
jgi:dienelactone hydrolase